MNEGVLKNQSFVMYYSKLLLRTVIKIPVNKFSFGKINGQMA